MIKIFLTSLLLLFLLPLFSTAQSVKIIASLDSSNYFIGDRMAVHISIAHPPGTLIHWVQPDTLSPFIQKISETKVDTIHQKSFVTENKTYTLITFDTGIIIIPPFNFFYEQQGMKPASAFSNSLSIRVSTIEIDTALGFRPIKSPLSVQTNQTNWLNYLFIITLILIVIVLYLLIIERRKKKINAKDFAVSQKSIHVLTLEKLRQLENKYLTKQDHAAEYYDELTYILREYIDATFEADTLEQSTDEMIHFLREKIKDPGLLDKLSNDFQLADLIKFARIKPTPDDKNATMNSAIDFVNKTSPKEK